MLMTMSASVELLVAINAFVVNYLVQSLHLSFEGCCCDAHCQTDLLPLFRERVHRTFPALSHAVRVQSHSKQLPWGLDDSQSLCGVEVFTSNRKLIQRAALTNTFAPVSSRTIIMVRSEVLTAERISRLHTYYFSTEYGCLLGCYTVYSGRYKPIFQRSVRPPQSGFKHL